MKLLRKEDNLNFLWKRYPHLSACLTWGNEVKQCWCLCFYLVCYCRHNRNITSVNCGHSPSNRRNCKFWHDYAFQPWRRCKRNYSCFAYEVRALCKSYIEPMTLIRWFLAVFWLRFGTGRSHKYKSVHAIIPRIRSFRALALHGFHAFMGFDVPSFIHLKEEILFWVVVEILWIYPCIHCSTIVCRSPFPVHWWVSNWWFSEISSIFP